MTTPESRLSHEDAHRVAQAREMTAAAGVPLRDRYGFASPDGEVLAVVRLVFREPDNAAAGDAIGLANATGEVELSDDYDNPIGEEYERRIVAALRPLVEQRRDAEARGL